MALVSRVVRDWTYGEGSMTVVFEGNNRNIDHIDIVNGSENCRIVVAELDGSAVYLDKTYAPFETETLVPPRNTKWTNEHSTRTSNIDINVSTWS